MRFTSKLFALCVSAVVSATSTVAQAVTDPALVIYTYSSLMGATNAVGDTYDFVAAYANYSGLNESQILVFRVESEELAVDAYNYTLALNTTYGPDIVIGMDSAEEIASKQIWYSFNLTDKAAITPQLANLYDLDHAKPFDYSLIDIEYDSSKFPEMGAYNNTFTLQSLLTNGTIANLTVENPTLDTSGLSFLLWTVAEFGDPSMNISSIYNTTNTTTPHVDSWQQFWTEAFLAGVNIVDVWDTAFNEFSDPTTNVSMIVSYSTDPAYNICQNYTNTIVPLVSHFNNTLYAYASVEVMSVVANATHLNQAVDFANWFFNDSNSNQIPESQWSLPANDNVTLPSCFYNEVNILPNETTFYNQILASQTNLSTSVNIWVNEWLDIYNTFLAGNLTNTTTFTSNNFTVSHKLARMLRY